MSPQLLTQKPQVVERGALLEGKAELDEEGMRLVERLPRRLELPEVLEVDADVVQGLARSISLPGAHSAQAAPVEVEARGMVTGARVHDADGAQGGGLAARVAGALVDGERAELQVEGARDIAKGIVDETFRAQRLGDPPALRRVPRSHAARNRRRRARRRGRGAGSRSALQVARFGAPRARRRATPATSCAPARRRGARARVDARNAVRDAEKQVEALLGRGGGSSDAHESLTAAALCGPSFTRDLDEAIVERGGATEVGQRLRRHRIGVAPSGESFCHQIDGATTTPSAARVPRARAA
jgi:hypothetical protein